MRILTNSQYFTVDEILKRRPELSQYLGFLNTPRQSYNWERLSAYNLPLSADNSAFSDFNEKKFRSFISRINVKVDWVAAPDIVGDATATLNLFHQWHEELSHLPLAFVAQDGISKIPIPWESFTCLFVGGTTAFKFSKEMRDALKEAKERGKTTHLGRVNSDKRLKYAYECGFDSVDGSSFWRLSRAYLLKGLDYLDGLHRQKTFFQMEEPRS